MGEQGIFDMKRIFNLENYNLIFCPLCNKNAKLPELDSFNACIKCGGFGFIMKEKTSSQDKEEVNSAKDRSAYLILRKRSIEDYEPNDLS